MPRTISKSIRKSRLLWAKAQKKVHGGIPLLSKNPDRFLRNDWPAYFSRAKGITVIDFDGNRYLDFSYMGVGPNLLGYADPDVNAAVKRVVNAGNQSTLNAPEDVELAEELLKLHPWADQVRYARTGGEIAAIAIRIARAHTGKDVVAFCGYHGWHDWYLAANLAEDENLDGHLLPGLQPLGVPRPLAGTAQPFAYNKYEELERIVQQHDVGVIAMEPMRHHEPEHRFLHKVRATADRIGAVLIFDEISSGFRLGFPGAHTTLGVKPDIAIYSKAISNGYPMAALVGKRDVMTEADASFISSTFHSERVGPAAALATLKKMKRVGVTKYVARIGKKICLGWTRLARKHRLPLSVEGPFAMATFQLNHPDRRPLHALFTQQMLNLGYLATPTVYVSYAHKESHLPAYFSAVDKTFGALAAAVSDRRLLSSVARSVPDVGFKRLT
jgi:glutamate-1-semialdehyde aminotransferase